MYDPTHTSDNEAMKGYQTFLLKFKTFLDISILRSRLACVVFLLWLFYNLGYPVPPVFLPLVSSNYGISKDTTSFMLSVYGISEFHWKATVWNNSKLEQIPFSVSLVLCLRCNRYRPTLVDLGKDGTFDLLSSHHNWNERWRVTIFIFNSLNEPL